MTSTRTTIFTLVLMAGMTPAVPAGAEEAGAPLAPQAGDEAVGGPSTPASTPPAGPASDGAAPQVAPASPISPTSQPAAGGDHADPPSVISIPAAPPPATVASVTATSSIIPGWTRNLSIGGGAILWYYQPMESGVKNNIDLFYVNLLFDGHLGDVDLHIEPRFRENKLRPHFGGTSGGTAWVQEVYASFKLPSTTLKVGKAYSHFGLFWDNSFYGNVQVYDGLKLDPDFGLSLEGSLGETSAAAPWGARFWAQYFVVDGQTNVALDGRETFTIPGARRRNQVILRLEPFIAPRDGLTVKFGLSGSYLQADLPVVGKRDVYRGAADVTVSVGPWALWSEVIRQNGQSVTDFPIAGTPATSTAPAIPGQASQHINYLLVGTELTIRKISLRYNVSYGGYRDQSVSEWMHVPAIGFTASPNLTFLAEYVNWRRYSPTGDSIVDKSLNTTLQAHF